MSASTSTGPVRAPGGKGGPRDPKTNNNLVLNVVFCAYVFPRNLDILRTAEF